MFRSRWRGLVVLAVSELVTNAVVHGEGEVVLRITVGVDVVRVSVTDHNPAPAVLKEAGPDGESGGAGSGWSMRSQTHGRAAARRRGVSSKTRGLQLEPDLQLVADDANGKPGSSVASVTQGAPRAVRLPSPSNSVRASRRARRADGSGHEAPPSVRSTVPSRSRAFRLQHRDR